MDSECEREKERMKKTNYKPKPSLALPTISCLLILLCANISCKGETQRRRQTVWAIHTFTQCTHTHTYSTWQAGTRGVAINRQHVGKFTSRAKAINEKSAKIGRARSLCGWVEWAHRSVCVCVRSLYLRPFFSLLHFKFSRFPEEAIRYGI